MPDATKRTPDDSMTWICGEFKKRNECARSFRFNLPRALTLGCCANAQRYRPNPFQGDLSFRVNSMKAHLPAGGRRERTELQNRK